MGIGIWLYNAHTGAEVALLKGHSVRYNLKFSSPVFSPDGRTLASGGFRGIWLWDVATGQHKRTLNHWSPIHSVAFSPDGSTIASGHRSSTIRVWDVVTGQHKETLGYVPVGGDEIPFSSVAFSPDGGTLASGSDGTLQLWNTVTWQRRATRRWPSSAIRSVAFSPDGSTVASGSWDHTVLLWDMSLYIRPQPPTPDFDGIIDIGDFLLFVAQFGLGEDDEGYGAQFDLDGDGMIGINDFLIFANAFGKVISSN